MLGFEGDDLKGLLKILERLSRNSQDEHGFLTHKQVRAYGRGLLLLIPSFNLPPSTEAQLKTLVACMSVKGLPLYDRAFFAKEALELVQRHQNSLSVLFDY